MISWVTCGGSSFLVTWSCQFSVGNRNRCINPRCTLRWFRVSKLTFAALPPFATSSLYFSKFFSKITYSKTLLMLDFRPQVLVFELVFVGLDLDRLGLDLPYWFHLAIVVDNRGDLNSFGKNWGTAKTYLGLLDTGIDNHSQLFPPFR